MNPWCDYGASWAESTAATWLMRAVEKDFGRLALWACRRATAFCDFLPEVLPLLNNLLENREMQLEARKLSGFSFAILRTQIFVDCMSCGRMDVSSLGWVQDARV